MKCRFFIAVLLCPFAGFSQSIQTTSFGGSGVEAATSVTVDAQGSVYMTGTTTSFDFPVLNAYQPANRGTELLVSRDSGRTWRPLPKLSPPDADVADGIPVPVLAVSPFDPNTIYAGNGDTIYKSTDGGQSFTTYTLPLPNYNGINGVNPTAIPLRMGFSSLRPPST